jgi:hypothetical protein
MALTLAKEIKTLQDFSAQAHARQCKALNFNGFKPMIRKLKNGWMCQGRHPEGCTAFGFGDTPEQAYVEWTYNGIPF